MTRLRTLSDDQLRQVFASHVPGKRGSGYREIGRRLGVPESTVRDAVKLRTAYAAQMKAKER